MLIKSLPLGANLYVKNFKVEGEPHALFTELYNAFSKHGLIYSIRLNFDKSGVPKEYAYI